MILNVLKYSCVFSAPSILHCLLSCPRRLSGLDSSSSTPGSGSPSSALPRPPERLPPAVLIPHLRPRTVAPRPLPCLGLLRNYPGGPRPCLALLGGAPASLDSSSSVSDSGSPSSALPRPLGRLPRPVLIPHLKTQTVAPRPRPPERLPRRF